MSKTVLLLGRSKSVLDTVSSALDADDVALSAGTSLDDVEKTMQARSIDHVIMGADIDLDDRMDIISYIFANSTSTTVHMKDWDSGPAGMVPFVNGILTGLTAD